MKHGSPARHQGKHRRDAGRRPAGAAAKERPGLRIAAGLTVIGDIGTIVAAAAVVTLLVAVWLAASGAAAGTPWTGLAVAAGIGAAVALSAVGGDGPGVPAGAIPRRRLAAARVSFRIRALGALVEFEASARGIASPARPR